MRQLGAIIRRETGAFFHSAMAPVVLTGFLVAVGLFFVIFVFQYSELSRNAVESARSGNYVNLAEGIYRPLVSNMTLFLLLLLPAVTMRLFSPEFGSGRYDLIASWPVADHVWVAGKWLSSMLVAALLILAASAYFGMVWFMGRPEIGPMVSAWIGLLLFASALTAWGAFFSTLYRHQMIAYFSTFALSMFLFLVAGLEPHLPGGLGRISAELSLLTHFKLFSRGVIAVPDILYFAGLTVVPLIAAVASLRSRRMPALRRPLLWLPAAVGVCLVLVVYLVGLQFPRAWDLTGNKRYSLAPQTQQVLAALPDDLAALRDRAAEILSGTGIEDVNPEVRALYEGDLGAETVEVLGFFQRLDPARNVMETLLESCVAQTRSLRYEIIDPEENLERVRQYGVTVSRTIVVQVGERWTTLLQPEESALINAVYRMVTGRRPLVMHLLGHGEHLLDSTERPGYSDLQDALLAQGYRLQPIYLADVPRIPAEADILIIAGPRTDPTPTELAAIEAFQQRGGAVLALFDPPTPPAWNRFLSTWNLAVTGDVLVSLDPANQAFGVSARTVVVTEGVTNHEITRSLAGVTTVFPMAQPLRFVTPPAADDESLRVLLATTKAAWAETDPATKFSGTPAFERGADVPGPLPLAAAVQQPLADGADGVLRLVVVGNSEFLTNANLSLGGNRDLLLNILGWLAQEETLINLRGRHPLSQPVVLTLTEKNLFGWGAVLIWPLLVGGAALAIMLNHRRRGEAG